MSRAISVCTFRYSWAILQWCSNTAMDSLELGQGVRGCKHTHTHTYTTVITHLSSLYKDTIKQCKVHTVKISVINT